MTGAAARRRSLAGACVAPAALAVALLGCRAVPAPPPLAASPTDRPATIYVVARGWHTDVGLEVAAIDANLRPLAAEFPGARYLLFGFGERDWLLTRQHTLWHAIEAALPEPAAILVTAISAPPEVAFAEYAVAAATVPESGRARLEAFLAAEMSATPFAAGPRPIAAGPYPGSQFYAATDSYTLFHSCNTWTAEALEAAGLAVRPEGVLFAVQVMARSHAAGAEDRPAPPPPRITAGEGVRPVF